MEFAFRRSSVPTRACIVFIVRSIKTLMCLFEKRIEIDPRKASKVKFQDQERNWYKEKNSIQWKNS